MKQGSEVLCFLLRPKLKLSISHWLMGDPSPEKCMPFDKEPQPQPMEWSLPTVPHICPQTMFNAWWGLRQVPTCSQTLQCHWDTGCPKAHFIPPMYKENSCKRDAGCPFDYHWRTNGQGHFLCAWDLPWEWSVDKRGEQDDRSLPMRVSSGASGVAG
jgi:hypothetical protein